METASEIKGTTQAKHIRGAGLSLGQRDLCQQRSGCKPNHPGHQIRERTPGPGYHLHQHFALF
jgi:hypothetical protein